MMKLKKDIMETENGTLREVGSRGVMNFSKDRAEVGINGRGKSVGEKAH